MWSCETDDRHRDPGGAGQCCRVADFVDIVSGVSLLFTSPPVSDCLDPERGRLTPLSDGTSVCLFVCLFCLFFAFVVKQPFSFRLQHTYLQACNLNWVFSLGYFIAGYFIFFGPMCLECVCECTQYCEM